ncbi:hypothetical protein GAP32_438 [Cronobacter phage vB_CsaM_GAP32]|uniref:Uncharacterized protein n=1 Tax=Cronobacter phage vB_CsaM_GAP32 TaxID=1141136 RepID=K4F7S0_9CAUD|nr:hypothetical protein GAP32_438 [Cronobacter phage vB_CsaM_GAP32]AFC21892.1 hypothetical protein GAP32_438 [Cronobacter phage vB_CsaM_GAP32]
MSKIIKSIKSDLEKMVSLGLASTETVNKVIPISNVSSKKNSKKK